MYSLYQGLYLFILLFPMSRWELFTWSSYLSNLRCAYPLSCWPTCGGSLVLSQKSYHCSWFINRCIYWAKFSIFLFLSSFLLHLFFGIQNMTRVIILNCQLLGNNVLSSVRWSLTTSNLISHNVIKPKRQDDLTIFSKKSFLCSLHALNTYYWNKSHPVWYNKVCEVHLEFNTLTNICRILD